MLGGRQFLDGFAVFHQGFLRLCFGWHLCYVARQYTALGPAVPKPGSHHFLQPPIERALQLARQAIGSSAPRESESANSWVLPATTRYWRVYQLATSDLDGVPGHLFLRQDGLNFVLNDLNHPVFFVHCGRLWRG